MKFITLTTIFLLFTTASFSQLVNGASAPSAEEMSIETLESPDWSFYADEDNRTFYIDFEKINVNLSDIVIKNSDGEIVFNEDVLELPVNAIYELNFEDYGKGDFVVELRSFTKIIRKNITIN